MWTVTGELFHVELLENMKGYNRSMSMLTKLQPVGLYRNEQSGKVHCRPTNQWALQSKSSYGKPTQISHGSLPNVTCSVCVHRVHVNAMDSLLLWSRCLQTGSYSGF